MERIVRIPTDRAVEFGMENRVPTGCVQFYGQAFTEPVHYVRWKGESYQVAIPDMVPTCLGQLATDCNTLEQVRINFADFVASLLGMMDNPLGHGW